MAYGTQFTLTSGIVDNLDRLPKLFGVYTYSGLRTIPAGSIIIPTFANQVQDTTEWAVFLSDQLHQVIISNGYFTVYRPALIPTSYYSDSGTAYAFKL